MCGCSTARLQPGMMVQLMHSGRTYEVKEVGSLHAQAVRRARSSGRARRGYVIANIKSTADVKIGDTITDARHPCGQAVAGIPGGASDGVQRHCIRSTRPTTSISRRAWRSCSSTIRRFSINRKARWRWGSVSAAASSGCCTWRSCRNGCGGEYGMDIIATYPSVIYQVLKTDGEVVEVDNPVYLPEPSHRSDRRADTSAPSSFARTKTSAT